MDIFNKFVSLTKNVKYDFSNKYVIMNVSKKQVKYYEKAERRRNCYSDKLPLYLILIQQY
ncbi:hypothetical protein FACS1894181_06490 [Bacteroidia bacterium]|nr:hypothetical protein FACS1894181_06490 [Bacteroidia bacterium]